MSLLQVLAGHDEAESDCGHVRRRGSISRVSLCLDLLCGLFANGVPCRFVDLVEFRLGRSCRIQAVWGHCRYVRVRRCEFRLVR